MSDDILVPEVSTRELSRICTFYYKKVRPHSPQESRGIFQQLQRLLKKGITPEMLQIAVENYANDPWVKSIDPRTRKNIRSFFAYENVLLWQKPVQRPQAQTKARSPEQALDALEQLDRAYLEEARAHTY